jgi:AcrR family transcriptional regulator
MSNSRIPIWARPEPGARQPRFSREQIAAAALAIADSEGFEAVSMRRIAAALDAGTMTLYHYVSTKDDLIALMDDALMAEILIPEGELPGDWRAALLMIARRTREVFTRHPWALLSLRNSLPGPNGMRHFEQSLAAIERLPISPIQRLELISLVDDFVFGHVLRSSEARDVAARGEADSEATKAIMDFAGALLKTGNFPHTAAIYQDPSIEAQRTNPSAEQARFERGLAALLDGFMAQLEGC